jgi:hypothetical protein
MPITEAIGALGSWNLTLREETPRRIRDALADNYFGHVTVHTGRINPAVVGDGLLASSRYTGVLRGVGEHENAVVLSGAGMAFWLGDEEDKGAVIETALTFTAADFTDVVRDLLPAAVEEGLLSPIVGTFTNTFQYTTPRKAIDYVCTTMGGEYRVNGDATLDAGAPEDLFVTDPKCMVIKRGAGVDMQLRALLGTSNTDQDVEDFTTRALLLAASTDTTVATGSADIDPGLNPYLDLHGNPVVLTRMVSESTTDATNADVRAQLQLNRFSGTRDALALSTSEYDINGSVLVGDYLWVFDPDIGLEDPTNEVVFRGMVTNPVKLRLIETTWPVAPGFTVAFRDKLGTWYDLTDYVLWESGQTTVKVGGYSRSLTGSGSEPIGRLPVPDASVPDVVTWVEPFRLGVYQSAVTGEARGEVILTWDRPDNTDTTPIVDGSHYEIRYRRATTPLYPTTWDALEALGLTWDQLEATGATWDNPILFPETEWQTAYAPFDIETFRLQELVPAMPYEAQIRAVDLATPANIGVWSALTEWQTTSDDEPPATPAAATIAASPLAVQMTHTLGTSAGGEFNLDRDLHHLELHGGPEPLFTPTDDTLLGKVIANWGMITGHIPVVQTFQVTALTQVYYKVIAVDMAGNKSLPSYGVPRTADLIDDQYISNLTVSKVTAGTITADWLMAGSIKTSNSGARTEQDVDGLRLYNPSNVEVVNLDTTTGRAEFIGQIQSGLGAQKIVINSQDVPGGLARVDLYDDGGSSHVTLVQFGNNFLQQRETDGARTQDGGFLQWQAGAAFFGYRTPSVESYVQFNGEDISFKGRFQKTVTLGGLSALYTDIIASSAASQVVTYGATMVGSMCVVCDLVASASPTGKYHVLSSASATGFTVVMPTGTYSICIWAARIS